MHFRTAFIAAAIAAGIAAPAFAAGEVNVYSNRQEHLIRPLLDRFAKEADVTVNLLTGKEDELLERMKAEGLNSPADVLLTVDVGRLILAKQEGLLQQVQSKALEAAVPAYLRDADDQWFGLSKRARVIMRAVDRVPADAIATYEELADPKWKSKICIRSSTNVYNISMMAALIEHYGAAKAEEWAKGVVANMARQPQGGDTDQIKAVAAGECDIAVANTYYYGRLGGSDKAEDKVITEKVAIIFPNQNDRGTHVNIAGGGVAKHAPNRENAVKLLEFLVTDEAQKIYAEEVYEYPVKQGIAVSEIVKGFGDFKEDEMPLSAVAKHQKEAVLVFDRAGWR